MPSLTSAHQLSVVRAQYAGGLVFNTGFVCYIFLTIRSLQLLARLPRTNSRRRLLLPYTIALLIINSFFTVVQNVLLEEATIEGPFGSWSESGCSSLLVLRSVFVAFPIFFNDILFIYRAGQLVEWQWRVLAAPCLLYFASFGFGIYGLIMFGTQDCRSAEGMPHDLVVTVSLTAVLNLILGGIIVYKLFGGRRAALAFLDRQVLAGRCARLAMFVIESALLWVIAAALHVGTAVPLGTAGIAPFFELLFEITTIVTPALLTYQIARQNERKIFVVDDDETNSSKADGSQSRA